LAMSVHRGDILVDSQTHVTNLLKRPIRDSVEKRNSRFLCSTWP
jgi:hypothetical protein